MKTKKIGFMYFYVHFITELVCFYYLSTITNSNIIWLIPFMYDAFSFVPQSLIGTINDKYPNINIGNIGVSFLLLGFIIFAYFDINIFISLILICIGNCILHISGAEKTLRNSDGKLSNSAIFVAGGSFGLITGKLLGKISLNPIFITLLILTMIPIIILSNKYQNNDLHKFNYVKNTSKIGIVILLAVFVVIIRGYMGYGIPTSWNKTVLQTVLLYVIMGTGKALGGILSDKFGIRKIAVLSTLLAIPFLCFGDNIMILSLIGVMLFSMTMAITLGILVSCLKNKPGLAFGLTTIGLFLGTVPIFFIKIQSKMLNLGIIVLFSIICSIILARILKEE